MTYICLSLNILCLENDLRKSLFAQSTFTGKERDEETGYGYFGARYMDHELMTMWLSIDPMADKYPSISPYAYCAWNSVKLVDPDGEEINPVFGTDGKLLGTDSEGYGGMAIVMDKKYFRQGMSHKEAEAKGKYLNKYGKGIHISNKDWERVVKKGGERQIPYISNESDHTIYYKPEGIKNGEDMNPGYNASGAYPIPAHTDLYASADGVAAPHIKKGEVFKMPDGLKIRVTNCFIIRRPLSSKIVAYAASQTPFIGGWNDKTWLKYLHARSIKNPLGNPPVITKQADHSWDNLFMESD